MAGLVKWLLTHDRADSVRAAGHLPRRRLVFARPLAIDKEMEFWTAMR